MLDAEKKDGKVILNVEDAKSGEKTQLDADVVLVAIGRRPVTNGLNLEAVGIEKDERGRIVVDDQYNTTCKGVKCIGDATFGPMLAHKAEEEGIAAVEIIKAGHGHVNYAAIPAVVYTHPEVAWVGKNEEELKKEGVEYKIGKFPSLPTRVPRPTLMPMVSSSSSSRRRPTRFSVFTSLAPTPVR